MIRQTIIRIKKLILLILSLAYNVRQIVCSSSKRKIIEPINYLLLTPISGNLGDHAIAQGVMKILNGNTVELVGDSRITILLLKKIIRDHDVLIITGGGFLGSLYEANEEFVMEILKRFNRNKTVIMPQTIYYETIASKPAISNKIIQSYRSNRNLIVMCRESRSFDTAKNLIGIQNIYLFPDTVLLSAGLTAKFTRSNTVILIFRDDKEAIDTKYLQNKIEIYCRGKNYLIKRLDTNKHKIIMPRKRSEEVNEFLEELLEARFVVTDRLHGMIFSYITQTPCIALNNINSKVESVYNDWLANSGYVLHCNNNIEETLAQIDSLVPTDRHNNFTKYMDEIRRIIQ